MNDATPYRAKKIIELLLEDARNPRKNLAVHDVGAILAFIENKRQSNKVSEKESDFLSAIEESISRWQQRYWKTLRQPDGNSSSSVSQLLLGIISRFAEGDESSNFSTQETELIRGYMLGQTAYCNDAATIRLYKDRFADLNKRYDRNPLDHQGPQGPVAKAAVGMVRNWYLVLGIIVIVVAIAYVSMTEGPEDTMEGRTPPTINTNRPAVIVQPAPEPTIAELRAKRPITLTRSEQALIDMDDLRTENLAETDPEVIADNMLGIANLYYAKVKDYKKAAEANAEVVAMYPDTAAAKRALPDLAHCYKRLGDTRMEEMTYYEILEHFPEDSIEHSDAQDALQSF